MDNKHEEIMRAIGRIEGRLECLPKIEKHLEILNGRVNKLEDFNIGLKAKVGTMSAVVGGAVGIIGFIINKYL